MSNSVLQHGGVLIDGGLASSRTCPPGPADRLELSGTRVRGILRQDDSVARILQVLLERELVTVPVHPEAVS